MTVLVLTIVGDDRAGLVAAVSRVVADHGGNWERSELAELAGTFAGVVEVVVPDSAADGLREALAALEGTLAVAVHENPRASERTGVELHGLSIDHLSTETRDAAMSGGRLFEAMFTARMPGGGDPGDVRLALEKIAAELQVDVTVAPPGHS